VSAEEYGEPPWLSDLDALLRAWPKVDGMWICCWCGAERRQLWALCRSCWRTLDSNERDLIMAMTLPERARWILQNRPTKPLALDLTEPDRRKP